MTTDTSKKIDTIIEDDDDELDLVKLVATNANDSNQYLVFVGSNGELYAMNVSKIEELLIFKELVISKNSDPDQIILGTADIRGQMTTIVNFDRWAGHPVLEDHEYELVIITSYGERRFALVVKKVELITTIEPEDMSDNSSDNDKASFITKVSISGDMRLCTIYDGDKMLLDIYEDSQTLSDTAIRNLQEQIQSDKLILFADDSKFVRKMVGDLFDKLEVKNKIYADGKELVENLKDLKPEDIGLIVTDMEMPQMGGREVIDHIRKNSIYNDINIIVHTNMSNNLLSTELVSSGTSKIIGKIDMGELSLGIKEYMR
ncbi:MAG: chemotaxis protein CheV [Campylobacteraceae bacterium]|nr:chemotaxis protein CheV [Campylobacteraceae bacterium]